MNGTCLASRYEVVRELGRGGMGVVYLARDPLLERDVAVKVIPPAFLDAQSSERFRREARTIAQLDHPGIVGIHDFGSHEDSLFLVMPYVRGSNLRELATNETLTLGDILDVSRQIAEALEYSHVAGIVHRDVKPENVMVSREQDGRLRARVTDFGLAVAQRERRLTASGMVVGTLCYLSPEQLTRQEIDQRTDVYALGTVMYELLTGDTPFSGDLGPIVYLIVHANAAPPSDRGVSLPVELEALIMSCLDKDRSRRPQRAQEVADALSRISARLDGSGALGTPHKTAPLRASSLVIGRQKELEAMFERLNDSASHCRLLLISGPAGIGKTTLVEELERLAASRRMAVVHASVAGMEHALPFGSLCSVIEEYLRLHGAADFSDLASELVQRFPMLIEIPELRDSARAAPIDRTGDRMSIFDVLARAFIRMASAQPLLIAIEDLHNGDVTVEALQHIVTRMASVPVLVVATFRSDEIDKTHPVAKMIESFRTDRHVTHLELGPLALDAHRQLVVSMLGSERVDSDVVERIFATSEGNPQFATELIRSLLESREIVQGDSGMWRLASEAAISAEALPATIHQTVERRLDRLSDRHRTMLSLASVAGRMFDMDDLVQLTGESAPALEDDVDQLLALGYLREERHGRGEKFAFASRVVRDVLYAAVTRRKRRALHRAFASYLEARNAGHLDRYFWDLLHHYAEGDVPEKVVEFGLRTACASLDSFSAQDAINAARKVLEFVEEEEATRAEVRVVLAEALHLAGRTEEALPEIDAAVRIFDRLENPGRACAAAALAAEMAWERQKIDETRRWVEKGLAYARRSGDEHRHATLLSLGATAANLRGHVESGHRFLALLDQYRPAIPSSTAPERSGTVQVAFGYPLTVIEPATTYNTWHAEISALLFDTLTAIDETARVIPRLAEWFTSENDSRRYRFRLREGVEFHDGRRVTAMDVSHSFARFLRIADPGCRCLLADIVGADAVIDGRSRDLEGIRVTSPTDLVIDLERPLPGFAAAMTYPALAIVPAGSEELGSDWKNGFVGSGPFRLMRFEPGRRIEMEANPRYWRPGLPRVNRLSISLGVRSADILSGFRDGRFSVAFDLAPDDFARLRRDRELGSRYSATPSLSTCFLALNSRNGPLRDRETRAHIMASIDVNALVSRLGTQVLPATSLFPPGLLATEPRPVEERKHRSDVTAVHAPLRAGLFSVFSTSFAAFAGEVASAISVSGFRVEVSIPERRAIVDHENTSYDLFFGRYFCDYPDTDGIAFGLLDSKSGILGAICGSPETDALLQRGRQETNPAVRMDLYRQMDQLMISESLVLPLFHEQTYCFARPEVEGFGVRRFFPSIPYEQLSLNPAR